MIDRVRLRAQLSKHEDRRACAYDDATGKPISEGTQVRGLVTVGVGRNLVGKGLSEDEIDYLLDNDIAECIGQAQSFPWYAGLDEVRKAAIVELLFNLGLSKFKGFKNFINFVIQRRWTQAGEELKNSLWYGQVKSRGDTLIAQIKTGAWQ